MFDFEVLRILLCMWVLGVRLILSLLVRSLAHLGARFITPPLYLPTNGIEPSI
ncbi:unnamed protein product [Penicillium salamii]|nr:unnamed protein product [Penicillium salamii]CAG8347321.1 unnamed protein product [Penicillium salamii]